MCFPSATLIRLYEFLKNSRGNLAVTGQSMDINQHQNTLGPTGPGYFDVDLSDKNVARATLVEDDGIEPTTPCLQSRCSPS
jgi:hypothetical protein